MFWIAQFLKNPQKRRVSVEHGNNNACIMMELGVAMTLVIAMNMWLSMLVTIIRQHYPASILHACIKCSDVATQAHGPCQIK